MDMKTNIERIEAMLINTCGCSYSEAVKVCNEAIKLFKLKDAKLQKRLKKIKTK